MQKSIFLFFLIILLAGTTCEKETSTPSGGINDPVAADVNNLKEPMEVFGWEILQASFAGETDDKNVVISPLSIAAALYMTYNGAEGQTKAAMAETLALNGLPTDSLNGAFDQLMEILGVPKEGLRLESANAIFWDENKVIPNEDFLQQLSTYYDAADFAADFEGNPEEVVQNINDWVSDQTEERIKKIIEDLNPEEVMFLINALYFIGDWDQPFPESSTMDKPFSLGNDQQINVPTMFTDDAFQYYQGSDFSAVQCDFVDTTFSGWFILPTQQTSVETLVEQNNLAELINIVTSQSRFGRIFLEIPKFEVNYKIQLNDVLKSMGMALAFDRMQADFSGIGQSGGNLYISRVEHKTYLKIDEKGAEGAAVTSVGVGATSLPPRISFNKPFLVLIMHKPTRTLIFAGKIENPLEE